MEVMLVGCSGVIIGWINVLMVYGMWLMFCNVVV